LILLHRNAIPAANNLLLMHGQKSIDYLHNTNACKRNTAAGGQGSYCLVRYWPEAPKALSESSGFQILILSPPGDYQKSRQSRPNNITKAGAFVKLRRRFREASQAFS